MRNDRRGKDYILRVIKDETTREQVIRILDKQFVFLMNDVEDKTYQEIPEAGKKFRLTMKY